MAEGPPLNVEKTSTIADVKLDIDGNIPDISNLRHLLQSLTIIPVAGRSSNSRDEDTPSVESDPDKTSNQESGSNKHDEDDIDDLKEDELSSSSSNDEIRTQSSWSQDKTKLVHILGLLENATVADREGRYQEALDLYIKGISAALGWLKASHKEDSADSEFAPAPQVIKSKLKHKLSECMTRAEKIKKLISGKKEQHGECCDTHNEPSSLPNEYSVDSRLRQFLVTSRGVRWDDVIGLKEAKTKLLEYFLFPRMFPYLFEGSRYRTTSSSVFLYGIPGSGKSMLIRGLAREIEKIEGRSCNLLHISSGILRSRVLDAPNFIEKLIDLTQSSDSGSNIVMMDDVEEDLCITEDDSQEMQDLKRKITINLIRFCDVLAQNRGPVAKSILVLNTSDPSRVYYNLCRRFFIRIYTRLPDLSARAEILKHHLKSVSTDLVADDLLEIGARTQGWTGSDLVSFVRSVSMVPVREIAKATHFRKVLRSSLPAGCPAGSDPLDHVCVRCQETDEGAQIIGNLSDWNPDEIYIRPVNVEDLREEVRKIWPGNYHAEVEKLEKFYNERDAPEEIKPKSKEAGSLLFWSCRTILKILQPLFSINESASVIVQQYDVIDRLPIPRHLKLHLMLES